MEAPEARSTSNGLAAWREVARRRQEIVTRVRNRSVGMARAEVEADLRVEFEQAGIPQPPEKLALLADGISGGRFGMLRVVGRAVRSVARGQAPEGVRARRHRLAGERWVEIELSADPAAQLAVRSFYRASKAIRVSTPDGADVDLMSARVTLIESRTGPRVGVFLGSTFVGNLPRAATQALTPTIIDTEARDQRVAVKARVEVSGDLCRLAVALP